MDKTLIAATILGFGLLTGCVSSKPDTPFKAAAAAPDPNDPFAPGLGDKFKSFLSTDGLAGPTAELGQASRLTAGWKPQVTFAPDPTHGGEPLPGLVARVYVFGPDESVPLDIDGDLIAGVWDLDPKVNDGKPKLMELWHIDADTLKKFKKKDPIGDGFSLFFPWSNYHVDLKQVNVVIRFNGRDGRHLTSAIQTLTLDHSATLQRAAEKLGPTADLGTKPEGLGPLPVRFGPAAK